jgi:zinc transport system substrate-binding protein
MCKETIVVQLNVLKQSAVFGMALAGTVFATETAAQTPNVAVDIAPLHSLVSMVMQGVSTPDLIVPQGQSPHGVTLRPSQARALSRADMVIWVGAELTPWLDDAGQSLAANAQWVSVLEMSGDGLLSYRSVSLPNVIDHADSAEDHDADHDEHHVDGHGDSHDEHHDDGHADSHDEHHVDGHEDGHADSHDHGHAHGSGIDPHAWLDPVVAASWLPEIAQSLGELDPENADIYRDNADDASVKILALSEEIRAQLTPVASAPFVTFHDGYQYFEHRYGLTWAGSVASSDAIEPGAAGLRALAGQIAQQNVHCALSEVQFSDGLLRAAGGEEITLARIDPIGQSLDVGVNLYPQLMMEMADAVAGCLSQ